MKLLSTIPNPVEEKRKTIRRYKKELLENPNAELVHKKRRS